MNRLRMSEVRNPFYCILTLDLCNNAARCRLLYLLCRGLNPQKPMKRAAYE
ncbi:MAG: hypothetical protein E5299_01741 [Burkholderia gladioli]|nr:MAG: hypothetical protein E5299_01741 [Burkholderia gladioli]